MAELVEEIVIRIDTTYSRKYLCKNQYRRDRHDRFSGWSFVSNASKAFVFKSLAMAEYKARSLKIMKHFTRRGNDCNWTVIKRYSMPPEKVLASSKDSPLHRLAKVAE